MLPRKLALRMYGETDSRSGVYPSRLARRERRRVNSQISGAARTTSRAAHAAQATMVAEAMLGVETHARKRKRERAAQAGVAFPALPFDVAVSLIENHLRDPADLAVLRAVSKGMRDAVDATGRRVEEFGEEDAVQRGYVSTLKCRRRRGKLKNVRLLCAAAARNGDLEALKALRAENFPWNGSTCAFAAQYGHLEVLKWARENGYPWREVTRRLAVSFGDVDTRVGSAGR